MSANRRLRPTLLEQTMTYYDTVLDNPKNRLQVLLCDDDCRNTLTIVYSQHQLLQHQVVLVDALQNVGSRFLMKHLHAVILCRPNDRSMSLIARELRAGNFASYRIYVTNMVDIDVLQKIANADIFDLVESIEEVFLDVTSFSEYAAMITLNPPALSGNTEGESDFIEIPALNAKVNRGATDNPISWSQWDQETFGRVANSLIATMLMTNRRPAIRYRAGNQVAQRLAAEVAAKMKAVHASFPDLKAKECVLLIVDRLDDPVTPLLTPWTYEAMIHEFIGFQRGNEVILDDDVPPPPTGTTDREANSGSTPASLQKKAQDNVHILSPQADPFFQAHRYNDYGQICVSVSELVETYKAMNNLDRTSASIEDIKNFMANFPEAKKQSSQVTRHASILGRMVDEVNLRSLTKISVLEQEMTASSSVLDHSKTALELVRNPRIEKEDALRVAILYHLRYEKSSSNITAQLKSELELRGCPPEEVKLIDKMVEAAGSKYRMHEIYRTSTGSMFKAAVSSIAQFGNEVQNVLTQHQPLLKKIVNRAYNGTLSEKDYPVQAVQGSPIPATMAATQRAKDVLVFMIGGITYEELYLLYNINKGLVDNNVETLMNVGLGMGKLISTGVGAMASAVTMGNSNSTTTSDAGPSGASPADSEPQTAKIEATVSLISTSMLNSKAFLKCIQQL